MSWFSELFEITFGKKQESSKLPLTQTKTPMPSIVEAKKEVSELCYAIMKSLVVHPERWGEWVYKDSHNLRLDKYVSCISAKDFSTDVHFKLTRVYYKVVEEFDYIIEVNGTPVRFTLEEKEELYSCFLLKFSHYRDGVKKNTKNYLMEKYLDK